VGINSMSKSKPPTRRDKFLSDNIKQLQKDREFFGERIKILEKRFDFIQDEYAKIAIEQQALIKGVQVIVDVAHRLMDESKVKTPHKTQEGMAGIS